MALTDAELLALHRALVETPSVSHSEGPIADLVEGYLRERGAEVHRIGDNVVALAGTSGPRLLLNSHLDTVPATDAWHRPPWEVTREGERIYGLGSNDAKAAVAGMIAAFLKVQAGALPSRVALMLVPEEETGGKGTEVAWPALREMGFTPQGVVVGEPTGLDVAVAQKGMLILELIARGQGCHSANAQALGAINPVRILARDLVALEGISLGPEDAFLGMTTLEPTVITGSDRRNRVPETARAWLDLRTVPGLSHEEIAARVQAQVSGEVRIQSKRLIPRRSPEASAVARAALMAQPGARAYGSRTMSDLVYFEGPPAIKVGPGQTSRSHTPDEYVEAGEVLAGARFYAALIHHFAELAES